MTILEWRRLLAELEERLRPSSILFHDLEEPLLEYVSGPSSEALPAALGEASAWLERAAAVLSTRQLELEQLTGWMTRLQAAGMLGDPRRRPEPQRSHPAAATAPSTKSANAPRRARRARPSRRRDA